MPSSKPESVAIDHECIARDQIRHLGLDDGRSGEEHEEGGKEAHSASLSDAP
jgi:hypothetical protein